MQFTIIVSVHYYADIIIFMLTSVYGNYYLVMGRVCITVNLLIDQIVFIRDFADELPYRGKVTKFSPGKEKCWYFLIFSPPPPPPPHFPHHFLNVFLVGEIWERTFPFSPTTSTFPPPLFKCIFGGRNMGKNFPIFPPPPH